MAREQHEEYTMRSIQDRSAGWWALLFIPVFFLAGWLANDAWKTGSFNTTDPQLGVGGGPGMTNCVPNMNR